MSKSNVKNKPLKPFNPIREVKKVSWCMGEKMHRWDIHCVKHSEEYTVDQKKMIDDFFDEIFSLLTPCYMELHKTHEKESDRLNLMEKKINTLIKCFRKISKNMDKPLRLKVVLKENV